MDTVSEDVALPGHDGDQVGHRAPVVQDLEGADRLLAEARDGVTVALGSGDFLLGLTRRQPRRSRKRRSRWRWRCRCPRPQAGLVGLDGDLEHPEHRPVVDGEAALAAGRLVPVGVTLRALAGQVLAEQARADRRAGVRHRLELARLEGGDEAALRRGTGQLDDDGDDRDDHRDDDPRAAAGCRRGACDLRSRAAAARPRRRRRGGGTRRRARRRPARRRPARPPPPAPPWAGPSGGRRPAWRRCWARPRAARRSSSPSVKGSWSQTSRSARPGRAPRAGRVVPPGRSATRDRGRS